MIQAVTRWCAASGCWVALGVKGVLPARVRAASSDGTQSAPSRLRGAAESLVILRLMTILVRSGNGRKRGGKDSQVRRPMMTGLPMVTVLKCARSSGARQGMVPSRPIIPASVCAQIAPRHGRAGEGDSYSRIDCPKPRWGQKSPDDAYNRRVQSLHTRNQK